jgi:hypothetical protein
MGLTIAVLHGQCRCRVGPGSPRTSVYSLALVALSQFPTMALIE